MVPIFKLVITDDADKDLARAVVYLSQKNAQKFSEELYIKYDDIKLMPRLYQRVFYEEKTKTDYRRIVHKKYIIIYKIHNNQITILRIVSEKEDYLISQFFKSFV